MTVNVPREVRQVLVHGEAGSRLQPALHAHSGDVLLVKGADGNGPHTCTEDQHAGPRLAPPDVIQAGDDVLDVPPERGCLEKLDRSCPLR